MRPRGRKLEDPDLDKISGGADTIYPGPTPPVEPERNREFVDRKPIGGSQGVEVEADKERLDDGKGSDTFNKS